MRMRRRNLLIVLSTLTGIVIIFMVALILVLMKKPPAYEGESFTASDEPRTVAEVDPWAGRGSEAIEAVQLRTITQADGTLQTLGNRAADRLLETTIEFFGNLDGVTPVWRAEQADTAYPSVYWVDLAYMSGAVDVGPRWAVQLDPEGPRGEFPDGVIPANALAEYMMLSNPAETVRFYNRSAGVLDALTSHQFEGGVRLGAALLVYFLGGRGAEENTVQGWVIVPAEVVEGQAPIYDAYFEYTRNGEAQVAQWEVNLETGAFRAQNLQASDIMSVSNTVDVENLWSIMPESITDPESPPEDERNRLLRAIRRVIHNDRLVEAVNALLTYEARTHELEYVGWAADRRDDGLLDVRYRYTVDGEETAVTWRVNPDEALVEPTSEVSITAARVLRIDRIADPEPEPEAAEEPPSEGSGDVPAEP